MLEPYYKGIELHIIDEPPLNKTAVCNNDYSKNKRFTTDVIFDDYDFRHSFMMDRLSRYKLHYATLINDNLFWQLYLPQAEYGNTYKIKNTTKFMDIFEYYLKYRHILSEAHSKILKSVIGDGLYSNELFGNMYKLLTTLSEKLGHISHNYTERDKLTKLFNEDENRQFTIAISKEFNTKLVVSLVSNNFGVTVKTDGVLESSQKVHEMNKDTLVDLIASMFMFNTHEQIRIKLKEFQLFIN